MADWLGLDDVIAMPRGDLSVALASRPAPSVTLMPMSSARIGTQRHTRLAGAAACGALAAMVLGAGGASAAPDPSHCGQTVLAAYEAQLQRQFPDQRVTAAVFDTRTQCWYHLHLPMRITTASVIKAQVLGAVLLHAQDEHRRARLTASAA